MLGWGLAFASVSMLMLVALAAFTMVDPKELAGDKRL